jgi:peptidoglycan/xylan/chitin deacetylase (PgdA/CDA1 family)
MVNTWVKNQPRDAWVDPGVHDDRIRCSRSPDYAETADDWKSRMVGEILTAKDLLVEHGMDSKFFAYPYGEYDKATLKLVGDLGMIGFGQQSGAIGPHSNPGLLPRYPLAGVYVDIPR